MTVQPNGTHAKEIALHFLKLTNQETTRGKVAHAIKVAKAILQDGYTREDILTVIDHVLVSRNVSIYSLGYIQSCMDEVLDGLAAAEQAVIINEQVAHAISIQRHEVKLDESTSRNREKASRTNVQRRIGAKFDFDLFERQ